MTNSVQDDLEQRRQLIEAAAGVASWEWRIADDVIAWSTHAAELFGIERAPASYAELLALVHPDDRARVDREVRDYQRQGGRFEHEFRVLGRHGEVRWILGRGEAARTVDGHSTRMFGITIDVTAQRRAESLLSESEARLRAVQKTARIGIYQWDIAADRIALDPILCAIFGVAENQTVTSEQFEEGLHPDDRAATRAVLRGALDPEGDGSYEAEYRVVNRQSGEVRWLHASGWVTFADRHPVRVLGAVHEISARRNAERIARESVATLRAAFENAAVGIARVAPDGSWLMANDRMSEILGYPRHELLKTRFQTLTHPDDLPRDLKQLERILAGEIDTYRVEKRYLHKDGHVVWGNLSVGVVRNADGSVHHFISVIEDITARRRAEEQRELLIEELNHRVRNMLTVVRALAAQTARHSDSLDAFGAAFDKRIQALATTHTLLSRHGWSASGLAELIEQQVLPHALVPDALTTSGPLILLAPKPSLALGLIVNELASNAAQYGALSRPEGRVSVSWQLVDRPAGRFAELRWTESGGPRVRPPGRTGFGSKLMDINVAHEFKGTIERDYRPDGLVCTLTFEAPQLDQP